MRLSLAQKTRSPMEITLSGRMTSTRLSQPASALSPMETTVLGIEMSVSAVNAKESCPIEVMPFGRVMLVRALHEEKR